MKPLRGWTRPPWAAGLSAVVFTILVSRSAESDWVRDGAPISPSDSAQSIPLIVSDGAAGAFVVWRQRDSANTHVISRTLAQYLDADGSVHPSWPSTGPMLADPSDSWFGRDHPVAVSDGRGGLLVADDGYEDHGRIVLNLLDGDGGSADWPPDGVVVSGVYGGVEEARHDPAPTEPLGQGPGDMWPSVALDGSGGVLVAWSYFTRSAYDVHVLRLDATGTRAPGWPSGGAEFGVFGEGAVLCRDDAGGAFVVWRFRGMPAGIYAHHVMADGSLDSRWPRSGLALSEGPWPYEAPGIVPDGTGGFLATWEDGRNGEFNQVYAQRVQPDGTVAPGWPTDGLPISAHPSSPGIERWFKSYAMIRYSSIVSDQGGGAIVAWTDHRDGTGNGNGDIYAVRVLGDGTIAAGWQANGTPVCLAKGDQRLPTLAPDGRGGGFIVWEDGRGDDLDIYAQHLTGSGERAKGWPADGLPLCIATGDQESPVATAAGSDRAIVAWVDHRGDSPNIFAGLASPEAVVPTRLPALLSAAATPTLVRITWFVGEDATSAEVYRRTEEGDRVVLATASPDAGGRVVYEDHAVAVGRRYGYQIGVGGGDAELFSDETWLEIPTQAPLALDGVLPNPASGLELRVSFTLPDDGPATLELLDATGRKLSSVQIGALGAGRHLVSLDRAAGRAPGLYWVRLTHSGSQLSRRACLVR